MDKLSTRKETKIRYLTVILLLITVSPVEAQLFIPIGSQTPISLRKLPVSKFSVGFQTGFLPNIDDFSVGLEYGITENHKLSISGGIRETSSFLGEMPLTKSVRVGLMQIIPLKNLLSVFGKGTLQLATMGDRGDTMRFTNKYGQTYGTGILTIENQQMYSVTGTIGIMKPLRLVLTTLNPFVTLSIHKSRSSLRTRLTSKQYNSLYPYSSQALDAEVQAGFEIELMPNTSVIIVTTISNRGMGTFLGCSLYY